jgi:hypothetical protein
MTADQLSFLTGRGLCAFQRRGGGLRLFGGAHTGLGRRPRSQRSQRSDPLSWHTVTDWLLLLRRRRLRRLALP